MLSAAAASWPHIHISDSLVMADAAVKMARAGCTTIAVLGVDFMSENVRAILDEAGLAHIKVGSNKEVGGQGEVDSMQWLRAFAWSKADGRQHSVRLGVAVWP